MTRIDIACIAPGHQPHQGTLSSLPSFESLTACKTNTPTLHCSLLSSTCFQTLFNYPHTQNTFPQHTHHPRTHYSIGTQFVPVPPTSMARITLLGVLQWPMRTKVRRKYTRGTLYFDFGRRGSDPGSYLHVRERSRSRKS